MYYFLEYEPYWKVIKKSRENLSYKEENDPLVNQCRSKLVEFENDLQAYRERKPDHKEVEEINKEMSELNNLEFLLRMQRSNVLGKRISLSMGLRNIDQTTNEFELLRWNYRSGRLTYQEVEDELFNRFIGMLAPTDFYREQYLRSLLREIFRPDKPSPSTDQDYYLR